MEKFKYVPDNLVIFPGFYESILYHSDMEYEYNYNEKSNFENYMEEEIDDFKDFERDVCIEVAQKVKEYLVDDDICESCEWAGMSSPREYNFTTDKLILDLEIDIHRLAMMVWYDKNLHEGFDKYLGRKYISCDGFWSFVENEIGEYMDKWDYLDVLVDYWLLTKIYDDTDVVKSIMKCEYAPYEEDLYYIADQALYNHMTPISEVEYICSECRKDDKMQWVIDNSRRPRWNFYGEDEIKDIFSDDELKARFYEENKCLPYDKYDNVN